MAFFLVFMEKGAGQIATQFNLNENASDIITGIILFFILGCEFFIHYQRGAAQAGKGGGEGVNIIIVFLQKAIAQGIAILLRRQRRDPDGKNRQPESGRSRHDVHGRRSRADRRVPV